MGFGPPEGDPEVSARARSARARGALTFALPGMSGDYAVAAPSSDPHIHQEMIEILTHTLYETVHVFFEHREMGHDVGASGFLYPFLGEQTRTAGIARRRSGRVDPHEGARCARACASRSSRAKLPTIATRDCGYRARAEGRRKTYHVRERRIRDRRDGLGAGLRDARGRLASDSAVSLSLEPAIITAVANDVGTEVIFLRQLVAQARPHDVAIALSTSGGSKNVVAALEEARKRTMLTIALLGYDGGEIVRRGLADIPIVVHCDYIPRIQEVQGSIYHIIREGLEVLARDGA